MEMTSVYVAAVRKRGRITGPVKVGVSNNPESRLRSGQTFCPYEMVLYHHFPLPDRSVALHTERAFHEINAEHQIHGEWFNMKPIVAAQKIALGIEIALKTFCDPSDEEMEVARAEFGINTVMVTQP